MPDLAEPFKHLQPSIGTVNWINSKLPQAAKSCCEAWVSEGFELTLSVADMNANP